MNITGMEIGHISYDVPLSNIGEAYMHDHQHKTQRMILVFDKQIYIDIRCLP